MTFEPLRIHLVGKAPLLMRSGRLADPLDPAARDLQAASRVRTKTDADFSRIAHIEWVGGLWLEGGAPCVPGEALEACFLQAARTRKCGQLAQAGLRVIENPLLSFEGPRDLTALWNDPRFRLRVPVRVGKMRPVRTRPIFPSWEITFEAQFSPLLLDRRLVGELWAIAGTRIGLGDWRPRYGIFSAEIIP